MSSVVIQPKRRRRRSTKIQREAKSVTGNLTAIIRRTIAEYKPVVQVKTKTKPKPAAPKSLRKLRVIPENSRNAIAFVRSLYDPSLPAMRLPDAERIPTAAFTVKKDTGISFIQDSVLTSDWYAGFCMSPRTGAPIYTLTAMANKVATWSVTDWPVISQINSDCEMYRPLVAWMEVSTWGPLQDRGAAFRTMHLNDASNYTPHTDIITKMDESAIRYRDTVAKLPITKRIMPDPTGSTYFDGSQTVVAGWSWRDTSIPTSTEGNFIYFIAYMAGSTAPTQSFQVFTQMKMEAKLFPGLAELVPASNVTGDLSIVKDLVSAVDQKNLIPDEVTGTVRTTSKKVEKAVVAATKLAGQLTSFVSPEIGAIVGQAANPLGKVAEWISSYFSKEMIRQHRILFAISNKLGIDHSPILSWKRDTKRPRKAHPHATFARIVSSALREEISLDVADEKE